MGEEDAQKKLMGHITRLDGLRKSGSDKLRVLYVGFTSANHDRLASLVQLNLCLRGFGHKMLPATQRQSSIAIDVASENDTEENEDIVYLKGDIIDFSDTLCRRIALPPFHYIVFDSAVMNKLFGNEQKIVMQRLVRMASVAMYIPAGGESITLSEAETPTVGANTVTVTPHRGAWRVVREETVLNDVFMNAVLVRGILPGAAGEPPQLVASTQPGCEDLPENAQAAVSFVRESLALPAAQSIPGPTSILSEIFRKHMLEMVTEALLRCNVRVLLIRLPGIDTNTVEIAPAPPPSVTSRSSGGGGIRGDAAAWALAGAAALLVLCAGV